MFLAFQKHFALNKSESNQNETTKQMAQKMAAINQSGCCHGNSNWQTDSFLHETINTVCTTSRLNRFSKFMVLLVLNSENKLGHAPFSKNSRHIGHVTDPRWPYSNKCLFRYV